MYPTAALGVIYDFKNMKQKFFGGGKTEFKKLKQKDESKEGHTDDVTALCISHSRKLVASGQNGSKPLIFLWDAETAEVKGKHRLPKGGRLVTAIGISATDKYVCASDAAEQVTCYVFKVGTVAPIHSITINYKVAHLAWSPHTEEVFATAGKDHMIVCQPKGDNYEKKTGKQKGASQSMCSVAWAVDPAKKDDLFTGGADGKIYHWTNDTLNKTYDNNKKSI